MLVECIRLIDHVVPQALHRHDHGALHEVRENLPKQLIHKVLDPEP